MSEEPKMHSIRNALPFLHGHAADARLASSPAGGCGTSGTREAAPDRLG